MICTVLHTKAVWKQKKVQVSKHEHQGYSLTLY